MKIFLQKVDFDVNIRFIRDDIMKNAIKKLFTIIFIGFMMTCLYAQVYNKLPDDFEEKYSSLDAYYTEQQEKEQKEREEAEAALIAAQKEAKEREAKDRIFRAFFKNNKSENIINYIKSFGGYFEIYSNDYEKVYIVWRQSEDNEYDYTIWHLSVEDKKCVLLSTALLEDVTKTYNKIAEYNGSYESFNFMYTFYKLDDELGIED